MALRAEEGRASFVYRDPTFRRDAIKVLPGEYFVSEHGELLVTVLGSCIAACIRDRVRCVGGMNHFMLPDSQQRADCEDNGVLEAGMRFGAYAMEVLINQLLRQGSKREHLEAKVFGGASMLSPVGQRIGARNAEFVERYLATERITLLAKDVLGVHARKVYFFSDTGKVMVHTLRDRAASKVVESEQRYNQSIEKNPIAGAAELF